MSFFPFLNFLGFLSILLVLLSYGIVYSGRVGGLSGGVSDSSSTIDHRDQSSYSVMDCIEGYFAHLDGRRLRLSVLPVTPRGSVMCVAGVCTIKLWVRGSNGGRIGADAVQRNHCVITVTQTVPLLGTSRRFETNEALATSCGICEPPLSGVAP